MVEIRKFETRYLTQTIDLFCELSRYYLGDMASAREQVEANLVNRILAEDSGVQLFIAILDDVVIGIATVSILYPAPRETGQLFLKELFVRPDMHNNGLGKQFMSFLAKYALDKNCSRFDWTADIDSKSAMNFYRSIEAPVLKDKVYFRADGNYLRQLAYLRNS